MGMVVNRFDVYLINLDPTIGNEIQKTRPYKQTQSAVLTVLAEMFAE
ncbi:MAG: hypothetical protein DDT27_00286 [Dehalococcoidia bacterium]|nr:hypothetical protein [Chloroflexota bacterium]MBT9161748.1 hypothetical protein [Chloroflexota bacterium]